MNASDTQWGKAAACVVLRDGKVLLGRHTYGVGKGLLILPGGYLNHGETPEQAAVREVWEETGVRVETEELVGIRFNAQDWYVIFLARYREGTARRAMRKIAKSYGWTLRKRWSRTTYPT